MKTPRTTPIWLFLLILAAFGLWLHAAASPDDGEAPASQKRMLIKIELDSPASFTALSDMHLDLASRNLRDGAHVIVTGDELREIERRGFSYEVLIADPSEVFIDPEFRDYEETLAYLDTLSQAYPAITMLQQVGVSQEFELPVWGIKISDNPYTEEDEPELLYTGVTHAREPLGNEICLALATTLLEGYGVDPVTTYLVNHEEIWIVPIVNTEGFKYMMDENLSNPWWRKNQRDNNENGEFEEDFDGVDLNRNYDFNWISGGSSDPSSWTYRGPSAFSEAETQNIRDLASQDHRFIFSISYHSYGEDVFWPWDWSGHPPPDEDIITDVAEEVASRIPRRSGTGTYAASPIGGLTGFSTNWLYGAAGSIDFTVEVCTEFIPSGTAIDSIVADNLPGALYLLERAITGPGITGHVTETVTGDPLQATVIIVGRDNEDITPRTCDPMFGTYFRMLLPGVYDVMYDMNGYQAVLQEVIVGSDTLTVVDIELTKVIDIALSQTELDDDQSGQSSGNGDGYLNPGETIELDAWLENIGILTAYSVSCTLSTTDPLVTVTVGTADYGDITPANIVQGDSPFVFSLSNDAVDGDSIFFQLTAADTSGNFWPFSLDLEVLAIEIDYFSMGIDDSEGGDGDGIPEAGETIDLIVALRNNGSVAATGVWAELTSQDPFISILADSSYFGDMGAGSNAITDPPYTITISSEVEDTHTVALVLEISADDGYYDEEDIQIHLSPVGIDEPVPGAPLPFVTMLHQNYPNPFNPSTKVEYDIAGDEGVKVPVRLAIYSVRGRLIRKLFSGEMIPGRHAVVWDGKDGSGTPVSSGVYIMVLETPSGGQSLKMLVQK